MKARLVGAGVAAALAGSLLGGVTPAFATPATPATPAAPVTPAWATFSVSDSAAPGAGPIVGGVDLGAPIPTIVAVSPSSGAAGTVVTVSGTNFSTTPGLTTAAFGLTAATGVSCSTTTTCTVTSPVGTGTVDITVAVGGKANPTSPADQFTYAAEPVAHVAPVMPVTPVAPVAPVVPVAPRTLGLAGVNRIQTAIAVSQKSFPTPHSATAVVLVRDDLYPDALTGGPLAVAKGGPLLLTGPSTLDPSSLTEIARVLPAGGTVYLLGGTEALSSSVANSLGNRGFHVDHLAGPNRFATAVAVAGAIGPGVIFEADGLDFPDALSAGPAAAQDAGAILLTNGPKQAPQTAAYISAHSSEVRYAVGGPAAAVDPSATPLVGADRFGTAVAVDDKFFHVPTVVGIATGLTFPDALAADPFLGDQGGPIILVPPTGALPASVATYLGLHRATLTTLEIFGGTAAVSTGVVTEATAAG